MKHPSTMSVKELKEAIRILGIEHLATGMTEKAELVALLLIEGDFRSDFNPKMPHNLPGFSLKGPRAHARAHGTRQEEKTHGRDINTEDCEDDVIREAIDSPTEDWDDDAIREAIEMSLLQEQEDENRRKTEEKEVQMEFSGQPADPRNVTRVADPAPVPPSPSTGTQRRSFDTTPGDVDSTSVVLEADSCGSFDLSLSGRTRSSLQSSCSWLGPVQGLDYFVARQGREK
jgi:hypothetical protein